MTKISLGLNLAQIAWVVKDIKTAKGFFQDMMGIGNFSNIGGTFIELIQPISGNSIFQDYLDKNPAGGIQHIAYSLPFANLDKVISEYADKGFPVISSFNHPIAKIVFF